MIILHIVFDSTTIHDTTFVYQHVFNAGLYFRVRRIVLKVWLLVKSLPKIGRQVSQPPQASNWREQEQCFLRSNIEEGNICPASGVFSLRNPTFGGETSGHRHLGAVSYEREDIWTQCQLGAKYVQTHF